LAGQLDVVVLRIEGILLHSLAWTLRLYVFEHVSALVGVACGAEVAAVRFALNDGIEITRLEPPLGFAVSMRSNSAPCARAKKIKVRWNLVVGI
jgi:hypothetical protein